MSNIFSYSKLQTYNKCPQKYKLTYVDKIDVKEEGIEAFVGKIVHEVLEHIYSLDNDVLTFITFDYIESKYNEIWKEKYHDKLYLAHCKVKYKKKAEQKKYTSIWFKAQGLNYLRSYYMQYGPNFSNINVVAVEKKIEFKISKYKIVGYIDRLDKVDNNFIINDYKTGKFNKNILTNDMQAFIYFYGIKKIYNTDNIEFNWHFLKNGYNKVKLDVQKNISKSNYIDAMKKKILEIINEIEVLTNENKTFVPKPSILCEWCYFWKHCSDKKNEIFPSIKL